MELLDIIWPWGILFVFLLGLIIGLTLYFLGSRFGLIKSRSHLSKSEGNDHLSAVQKPEYMLHVFDNMEQYVLQLSPDYRIEYINPSAQEKFSFQVGELCYQQIGKEEPCSQCPLPHLLQSSSGSAAYYIEVFNRNLKGNALQHIKPDGNVSVITILEDETEHKQVKEALKESEIKYREVLAIIKEGCYEIDCSGNIIFCNHSAASMLGYDTNKLMEINFKEVCNDPEAVFYYFSRVLKSGRPEYALTMEMIRKDGSLGYGELSITPVKDNENNITSYRVIIHDITERWHYEEQLRYLSFRDQLTGLYNRAYFENELERLEGSREYPITIITIDLDDLKLVNDTLGHFRGDELLKSCAVVLQDIFRTSDIISRVGSDEFAVILPRTSDEARTKIVHRINSTIENFNEVQKHKLPLHISVGSATADDQNKSLEETYKEADNIMYQDQSHKGIKARSQMIQALITMLGEKDYFTKGHTQRLEDICSEIGKRLNLSNKQLSNLIFLAQMHDLGKVGIPDRILFKEGTLTAEEWEVMQQHAEKGYRIALSSVGLAEIADLILKHHERWDGTGYPLGLKGEEIPIECRILAVVDAYDAMTNDRPYRKAMTHEEAVAELQEYAGCYFDPQVVQLFFSILEEKNVLENQ